MYFFTNTQGEALIVNCEVKVGDKADQQKLKTALAVYRAYSEGVPVAEGKEQEDQEVGDESAED